MKLEVSLDIHRSIIPHLSMFQYQKNKENNVWNAFTFSSTWSSTGWQIALRLHWPSAWRRSHRRSQRSILCSPGSQLTSHEAFLIPHWCARQLCVHSIGSNCKLSAKNRAPSRSYHIPTVTLFRTNMKCYSVICHDHFDLTLLLSETILCKKRYPSSKQMRILKV